MKKKHFVARALLLGLVLLLYSCENEIAKPIPEKHPSLSQGKYDKYLSLLKEAYRADDHFGAAMQLANLKAEGSTTFQLLNKAINEAPNRCDKIYEWYWLYDRHNFGMNILKLDTIAFKRTISLCDRLHQNSSYQEFAERKDDEERQAAASKEVEDSTNFNLPLVAALKQIHDDDQEIRTRLTAKNITPELKQELIEEMLIIDSINLIKIDRILEEYGYPSRTLVGKDGNFTPALVIHHSNTLETRYKYLPLLEKAVEDGLLYEGTLDMIKRRIEDMELDRE